MNQLESSTQVTGRLRELFRELAADDEFREALAAAQTTLLMRHDDAAMLLHVGPDGLSQGELAPRRATLVLECSAATADDLWSGRTSLPSAITQGRLRIRGRVAKVLAVMPALTLVVEHYRRTWGQQPDDGGVAADLTGARPVEVAR